jgi:hypothetical protein
MGKSQVDKPLTSILCKKTFTFFLAKALYLCLGAFV